MGRAVGIDLGTANSVVCVWENGRPTVIADAGGARVTPSVVGFDENGTVLVGRPAVDRAVVNADRTFDVVRCLAEIEPLSAAGKNYTATELAAQLLRKLRLDAEIQLGEQVTEAVVSLPVGYSDGQRRAVEEACALAGLRVLRFTRTPGLAALASAALHGAVRERSVLVFDLGANTFGVGLFEVGEDVVEVRALGGDPNLGGAEWDRCIADWLLRKFVARTGIDPRADARAMRRIREAAERAKIELSSVNSTTISLPYLTADADRNPLSLEETLSRVEFQQLTAHVLERCRKPVAAVLAEAGASIGAVEVVLLGGATRMPLVSALIRDITGGREPNRSLHTEETVAVGAAVRAAVLRGEKRDLLLLDVGVISLGMVTEADGYVVLTDRTYTIPTTRRRLFTTTADGQSAVHIRILVGDSANGAANPALATLTLTGLPPAPRGTPLIEITADVDAGHAVRIRARHLDTQIEQSVTVFGGSTSPAVWSIGVPGAIQLHPDDEILKKERESRAENQASGAPEPAAPAKDGSLGFVLLFLLVVVLALVLLGIYGAR